MRKSFHYEGRKNKEEKWSGGGEVSGVLKGKEGEEEIEFKILITWEIYMLLFYSK